MAGGRNNRSRIGSMTDLSGNVNLPVVTQFDGLVMGNMKILSIHDGNAVCYLLHFDQLDEVAEGVENLHDNTVQWSR